MTDGPWPQPPFWPEDYPILLELLGEEDFERIVGRYMLRDAPHQHVAEYREFVTRIGLSSHGRADPSS
jgi:hypothetical protein